MMRKEIRLSLPICGKGQEGKCHLLRCRQSTMSPHRLLPPPCRLTKYPALTI